MQFVIQSLPTVPDVGRIEEALIGLDPSAMVDFDASASALRVSTVLEPASVVDALGAAGLAVEPAAVQRKPSECCGGCGG